MRLFIAVDISEEVRARVAEAAVREQASVDARWVRSEGMHITLVFFGEQPPERVAEIVAAATPIAAGRGPLRLQIKGAGTFTGKSPRILWLGVEGAVKPLEEIAARLGEALGIVSEHPDYTPHLTLARAQQRRGDPMLNEVAKRLGRTDFGTWEIDHLTVYESAGGKYRALASIPLEG